MRMSTLAGGTTTVSIIESTASARAGGGGGGSGTINSGTIGNLPSYSAATTLGDSGIVASNVTLLSSASTQTLQCTSATNCFVVKQAVGGGNPFVVEASGGGVQYVVSPGSAPVNQFNSFGGSTLYNVSNNHLMWSSSTPTIAAAGCGGSAASITTNNGTAAFKVGVGTSNSGTCTVTMPGAATDWICSATDITTTSTSVSQTKSKPGGTPTTQITLQNYTDISGTGAWTDSDVIAVSCRAE
jgi:hypothetical protein